ncbi:MAG: glycosyltransferase [Opitutaceae bacterium]|nr:glycosyltransferase [Opitutaceae bacterium]
MLKVSFIIPLYNGLELTQACLRSLQSTLPAELTHEIIFVDDGSTDGSREWLKTLPDPCRHLLNETNLKFAGSNNRGAREAEGELLALLNNDLELLPGWIEPLLTALDEDQSIALIGNVQRRVDNDQIDHAGIRFRADAKLEHIRELPSASSIRRKPVRYTAAVTAACCLVRRKVFLDTGGGFRQEFENGGEDVDLCLALADRGQRVAIALNSVVRHHVSASRGKARPHDEANSRRLFGRWRGDIINLCAADWARTKISKWTKGNSQIPLNVLKDAISYHWGITKRVPKAAWVEIGSAIFYEEIHWRKTLGIDRPPTGDDPSAYQIRDLRKDDIHYHSYSFRNKFTVIFAPGTIEKNVFVNGFIMPPTKGRAETEGELGLRLTINGVQSESFFPLKGTNYNCGIDRPMVVMDEPVELTVELVGTEKEDLQAWLGRITQNWPLPRIWRLNLEAHRPQLKNRRLRVGQILCDEVTVFDFSEKQPLRINRKEKADYPLGLNVVGWFKAELGIGESARCMARATAAADIPHAFVDMKLPCLNRMGDNTFASQLQSTNPYRANVFHIDPPVSLDIDHHHGAPFRRDRHNIAYWAWELPEFPDQWVDACQYYDEIWCPSAFVRDAIAAKVPLPVQVMPHAISFAEPVGEQRAKFQIPPDRCTFLFLYDLNSYQERKNPHAVIEAYRRAFPDESGVQLVIKTQNPERNPGAYKQLKKALSGLTHTTLIDRTLSREDVHNLEAACDVFVSLHRSEGFGLAVAEAMFLGKPVISTNWSATAEFVNDKNGFPIAYDLIELTETHGPYEKGQVWADPRVDDAAAAMKTVAALPDRGRSLGEQGAHEMRTHFSPQVIGDRYAKRLAAMELWPE